MNKRRRKNQLTRHLFDIISLWTSLRVAVPSLPRSETEAGTATRRLSLNIIWNNAFTTIFIILNYFRAPPKKQERDRTGRNKIRKFNNSCAVEHTKRTERELDWRQTHGRGVGLSFDAYSAIWRPLPILFNFLLIYYFSFLPTRTGHRRVCDF